MHNEKEREKRSGGAAHPERNHKASLHSLLLQRKQTRSVCGGTVSAQCGHGGEPKNNNSLIVVLLFLIIILNL
jgi:hypothetical protein